VKRACLWDIFGKGLRLIFQEVRPKVYTNLDDMLSDNAVDAVDICTPVFLHHQNAILCAKAGVHATVEKPFAITIKAAKKMIEASENNGTILGLSENQRRTEDNRATKWLIDGGYIGTPEILLTGYIAHIGDAFIKDTPWRHAKLKAGAGGALDLGSHYGDLWRYLFGEVEEATGAMKRFKDFRVERDKGGSIIRKGENTVEDVALALLKFENGVVGQYCTGFDAPGEGGYVVQEKNWIIGSKGCIKGNVMILNDGTRVSIVEFFKEKADNNLREKLFPYPYKELEDSFAFELNDFVDAITNKGRPETDGYDGLKSIAICYAIIESAFINRPVKVKEVESGEVDAYQREIDEYYNLT